MNAKLIEEGKRLVNNLVHDLIEFKIPYQPTSEIFFKRSDDIFVSLEDPDNTLLLKSRSNFITIKDGNPVSFNVDTTGCKAVFNKIRAWSNEAYSENKPKMEGASYGCELGEFIAVARHILQNYVAVDEKFKPGCGTGNGALNYLTGRVINNDHQKHKEKAWVEGFIRPTANEMGSFVDEITNSIKGTSFESRFESIVSKGIVDSVSCDLVARLVESSLVCEPILIPQALRAFFVAGEREPIFIKKAKYLRSGVGVDNNLDPIYFAEVEDIETGAVVKFVGPDRNFDKAMFVESRERGIPLECHGTVIENIPQPIYPTGQGVPDYSFTSYAHLTSMAFAKEDYLPKLGAAC